VHTDWIPAFWMVLPFAGLLISIALFPLVAQRFWHQLKNQAVISLAFSIPVIVICLKYSPHALLYSVEHYVSFVILLGALFTVSGGIWLSGTVRSTPLANTLLLGAGAVLANFIGTTGASMILIRPLLLANAYRKHHTHLPLFFIMIVSNVGGLLTPLGDPPLFLGFLQGVPFFWTLTLWPVWLTGVGLLLAAFYIRDTVHFKKEGFFHRAESRDIDIPPRLNGLRNLACLGAIIGAFFIPTPYREAVMLVAAAVSYWITPKEFHEENNFNFYPIIEVAILFLGIFITMVPALELLRLKGGELTVTDPRQFFWATGFFSAFLDNAPTYLTFVALGQGLGNGGFYLGLSEPVLRAISVGAVFFGATTYIGNAPNFMVRSIAETSGWKMPSFFSYIAKASLFLIPLFLLITLIFFRS